MHQLAHTLSQLQKKLPFPLTALFLYVIVLALHSFYGSRVVSFNQDQARDVTIMQQYLDRGQYWVGYGPKASVGNFYLPPLYYQLHLWFAALTHNAPLVMHWVIIVVESATPVVLFLLLKRIIDAKYAALVALAYGLSPLATIFATFAWNPNMIPFFSTLALYGFYLHAVEEKKWPVVWASLSVVIAIHLHYQAVVLIPFAGLVFLWSIFRDWKNIRFWMIGGALALLTLLPYFWQESLLHWQNTRAMYSYFTTEHSQYYDRVSKFDFIATFLPSFTERVVTGQNLPLVWVGRVVFLLGFAVLGLSALRNKKYRWLLVYFATIVVMLRFYKGDKLDYYMSTLFILPFILLGSMLQRGKWVALPFLFLIFFFAGRSFGRIGTENGMSNLQANIVALSSIIPSSQVNMIYHGDNLANLYAYGFEHYSQIEVTPQARTVIDFCGKHEHCEWNQRAACEKNRIYTYASLIKTEYDYHFEKEYQIGEHLKAVVGTLKSSPSPTLNYSPYYFAYGNDLLEVR